EGAGRPPGQAPRLKRTILWPYRNEGLPSGRSGRAARTTRRPRSRSSLARAAAISSARIGSAPPAATTGTSSGCRSRTPDGDPHRAGRDGWRQRAARGGGGGGAGPARTAAGRPDPARRTDGGATVDCDARELVGFAHLGSVYVRDVLDRTQPGVGLLNVGEEDEKGNAVVKEAHQLLTQTPGIQYVGNVEGRDILAGQCKKGRIDVVVCDGFVGNVVLKFYESAGRMFMGMMKQAFPDVLGRPEAKQLFKFLDYSEYGGAPLLGVKGVVIICHGASPARAIVSA